ncbi:MAG: hypothetical protein HDT11_02360 [Helicobacter sp.]|nr:hypothetical protein [Helicobacter sp.]MBD5167724.1 hypothetical protein [Helicobacter sp.]MDE7195992.1 hypothetical protein [Helicobacter sp.]
MQIAYAPVGRFYQDQDYNLTNIAQGFDVQVLETLCDVSEDAGVEICYLSKYPQNVTQAALDALHHTGRISRIDSLQNLQDTCCMVTTTSHIAYAYAFYYQKPVIFFLPAFSGITLDSPQFAVLNIFGIFAHSLESLREKVLFCVHDSTPSQKIGDFLARSLL